MIILLNWQPLQAIPIHCESRIATTIQGLKWMKISTVNSSLKGMGKTWWHYVGQALSQGIVQELHGDHGNSTVVRQSHHYHQNQSCWHLERVWPDKTPYCPALDPYHLQRTITPGSSGHLKQQTTTLCCIARCLTPPPPFLQKLNRSQIHLNFQNITVFTRFQCGDRLYTSQSDVYRRQILTYKHDPRTEGIKLCIMVKDP